MTNIAIKSETPTTIYVITADERGEPELLNTLEALSLELVGTNVTITEGDWDTLGEEEGDTKLSRVG